MKKKLTSLSIIDNADELKHILSIENMCEIKLNEILSLQLLYCFWKPLVTGVLSVWPIR